MTTQTRRDYYLDKPDRFWACKVQLLDPNPEHGWFEEADGIPVLIDGFGELDTFAYRAYGGWHVCCGVTGRRHTGHFALPAHHDLQDAIAEARQHLEGITQGDIHNLRARIERNIGRSGLSPRYAWADFEAGG